MAQPSQYHSGAIIHTTQTDTGYAVEQVEVFKQPPFKQPRDDRIDIDFSIGPITLKGWIIPSSLTVHLDVVILGITIGTYDFNLNEGLTLKIDLFVVSGEVRFYGKNGNELWVSFKLKSPFGNWEDDVKIISF